MPAPHLVNCPGAFYRAPFVEVAMRHVGEMFALNALGAIFPTQTAFPVLHKSGGGSIVNILSGAALLSVEGCVVYAATKAALAHFAKTLAPELRRSKIGVNSIGPGSVRTPMFGFTSDALTPE